MVKGGESPFMTHKTIVGTRMIDMRKDISNRIQSVTNRILKDYQNGRDIDNMNVFNQPDSTAVIDIVNKLLNILFPGYYRPREFRSYNYDSRIAVVIEDVIYNLQKQIAIALRFKEEYSAKTRSSCAIRDFWPAPSTAWLTNSSCSACRSFPG